MLEVRTLADDTVGLSGNVSMSNLLGLRKELEGSIAAKRGLSFNICLQDLKTFNSAVLSMLLCLIRRAEISQCNLNFINVPSGLFDMARVGGIEALINNS